MELFLNLLWLSIAAAILLLWRIRWAHQPRHAHCTPLQQWTSVACALAFLFFVVSLSYDLHAEKAVLDAAGRRTAMLACAGQAVHSASGYASVGPSIVSKRFLATDPRTLQEYLVLASEIQFSSAGTLDASGRSPPASAI